MSNEPSPLDFSQIFKEIQLLEYPIPPPPPPPLSSSVTFFCVQWISGTESRIINPLVPKRPGKNISQIKDKNKKYLKQNMKKYIFKKIFKKIKTKIKILKKNL